MLIRLNPQEMGRIEVRLSFDDAGAVRAVLASESPAALEMLRRDSADLARSLNDAGVRADAQSFRFDGRGSGDGQQPRQQHGQRQDGPFADAGADAALAEEIQEYRRVRTSGTVDVIA
jgi:flagellar hook-length control protein FliK